MFAKILVLPLAALALGTVPSHAIAQESAPSLRPADTVGDALLTKTEEFAERGFSGFLMIEKGGEWALFYPMGAAEPGTGRAYDADTQIDIGSIAKTFTGLAMATLMAEGKVAPDQTLADWFDEVPQDKAGITVHQLLTHTAGLTEYVGGDRQTLDRDGFVQKAFDAPLRFAPGERYFYSNTGFSLAAAIIEKASGKAYEDYLVDDVLKPLGLTSTGYYRVYDPARADVSSAGDAVAQASWGGLDPVSWNLVGNGGLVSSARDLLRLATLIRSGGIDPAVRDLWIGPHVSEGAPGFNYGYGIGVVDGPFGREIWHNGGNPHFQSEWRLIEKDGLTVIVHRNGGDVPMEDVVMAALETAYGVRLAMETD